MARILIVDDEPMNLELIHAYLEGNGHVMIDADSGERALELAQGEPPDLVLLDVMMPGMNGFETTRRLKEMAGEKFLPVILITSLSDPSSRLLGLRIGADEFLSKPIDRQELTVRLRNLLALRAQEVALAERNLALAELSRFRDEMSAMIVHDLKNPMAVIVMTHDYLREALKGADHAYVEALEDAQSAGQRILRLLANLLDVAQVEGNRLNLCRTMTPLGTLVNQIAAQRRLAAEARGIAINVMVAAEVQLRVDPDLFTRVIENIFDNSLRYTPREGRIEVSARAVGAEIQVRIGNSGPPVPVESRKVIFEKFGQGGEHGGRMNLGLGLYFCRLAVEAHGGKIWVEETAELPTVFVLQLPV